MADPLTMTQPAREVWMPVSGYEGLYEISNLARVRNVETGKLLKPAFNRGYAHVALYSSPGTSKTHYLHTTVLRAFCGPPPFPGAQGCHNDGDRANNRLTNLRWGTAQDNSADRDRHGREVFGVGVRTAKLNEEEVRKMRDAYRAGKSTYQLAREYKMSTHSIWCAVTGKTWKRVQGAVRNVG